MFTKFISERIQIAVQNNLGSDHDYILNGLVVGERLEQAMQSASALLVLVLEDRRSDGSILNAPAQFLIQVGRDQHQLAPAFAHGTDHAAGIRGIDVNRAQLRAGFEQSPSGFIGDVGIVIVIINREIEPISSGVCFVCASKPLTVAL